MRHPQPGVVVAVTLTREVRPGEYRTEWIDSHHVPTGLFVPSSAVDRFLAMEHRQIKQSLYRRPAGRRLAGRRPVHGR